MGPTSVKFHGAPYKTDFVYLCIDLRHSYFTDTACSLLELLYTQLQNRDQELGDEITLSEEDVGGWRESLKVMDILTNQRRRTTMNFQSIDLRRATPQVIKQKLSECWCLLFVLSGLIVLSFMFEQCRENCIYPFVALGGVACNFAKLQLCAFSPPELM